MNANEAQAEAPTSGAPLQLTPAACCCPECCTDGESGSTDTPCC